MRLALFDLDDTLLDGDSDVEWCALLARSGAADLERTLAFHRDYQQGRLDIDAFMSCQLEPLAREPLERLLAWREEWLAERVLPRVTAPARGLLERHARLGHAVVLITATNRFLAERVAAALGIEQVIATEPEGVDGRFTGRVAGRPCFREGKVAAVEAWLAARGLDWEGLQESWFYSDSFNDLPLLSRVQHPVAVNADLRLAAHALQHGWQQLELRCGPAAGPPA